MKNSYGVAGSGSYTRGVAKRWSVRKIIRGFFVLKKIK
jgi:hypothetical protein